MIRLILLILMLLFLNNEIFNTSVKKKKKHCCLYLTPRIDKPEIFISGQSIAPFNHDEYKLLNPDMEYYYDETGRKGNLFRKQNYNEAKSLEINKPKFDNVNSVLNKLEIYPEQVYNLCN